MTVIKKVNGMKILKTKIKPKDQKKKKMEQKKKR